MDGMIGIRGEFLIALMAENLRGVALVKVPQCFGPTFHTSHGLQARHGHHAIGCQLNFLGRCLIPFGCRKVEKTWAFWRFDAISCHPKNPTGRVAIINTSHQPTTTTGSESETFPPPVLTPGSSNHQAKLGSGTASSSSKRCRSSSARRSASPSTSASDL